MLVLEQCCDCGCNVAAATVADPKEFSVTRLLQEGGTMRQRSMSHATGFDDVIYPPLPCFLVPPSAASPAPQSLSVLRTCHVTSLLPLQQCQSPRRVLLHPALSPYQRPKHRPRTLWYVPLLMHFAIIAATP